MADTFFKSFTSALLAIITSEIGDKTFIVAAMLSMKYPAFVVFVGAAVALVLMTILSAAMGAFIAQWVSETVVHYACIGLFVIFGAKLLFEAVDEEEGENEELKEVEMELKQMEAKRGQKYGVAVDLEEKPTAPNSVSASPSNESFTTQMLGMCYKFISTNNGRVGAEAFILTFLGEWGDRSQITTVSLAANGNPYAVSLGGLIGHLICTAIAVIGGKMLATRISMRHVNIAGGLLFLAFAIHGLLTGVHKAQ